MRQRLVGVGRIEDLVEGVAGAGEQLVGMGRVDREIKLQASGLIHRRVGQAHRRHEPRQGRALPGDIHGLGVRDD